MSLLVQKYAVSNSVFRGGPKYFQPLIRYCSSYDIIYLHLDRIDIYILLLIVNVVQIIKVKIPGTSCSF